MQKTISAGAAATDITPPTPQFLYGYPHVERISTGVHDPLLSSALFLSDGQNRVLLIANDVIFISKALAQRVRSRIREKTGIPETSILIAATHTHSGPVTVDYISNTSDPLVPPADRDYLDFLQDRIVEAALNAVKNEQSAQIGLALADSSGIGTNRHHPGGPADPQTPVLLLRSKRNGQNLACLLVCSMHPTVLHEDSTLISADFPGQTRKILQKQVLGADCPLLHFTGPAGNQSPRHVISGTTFAEAERLGGILAAAVTRSLDQMAFFAQAVLASRSHAIDLPRRPIPTLESAHKALQQSIQVFKRIQEQKASPQEIRTAECDIFGAEETLTLARAAEENRLEAIYQSCLPAEIQLVQIGPWNFIAWPGEFFVEYALAVKKQCKNTFVISLANGELQGYIVTPEAVENGYYEAGNALFAPQSGQLFIAETMHLLNTIGDKSPCRGQREQTD